MKKIILFNLIAISANGFGQEVISSQGEHYSGSSGSIEFTIGEPVVETVSDGNNDVTQGFHQTKLTVTAIEDHNTNFDVSIFPNPTSNYVQLNLEDYNGIQMHLYDVSGKLVTSQQLKNQVTKIDMSNLTFGNYIITLSNTDNTLIKSYKIIKQ